MYKRARLLGRLESKHVRLAEIIDANGIPERSLVYCGEGAAGHGEGDDPSGDEILNIDLITKLISKRGYRVTKFTSREDGMLGVSCLWCRFGGHPHCYRAFT
jgi:hypothetical protein